MAIETKEYYRYFGPDRHVVGKHWLYNKSLVFVLSQSSPGRYMARYADATRDDLVVYVPEEFIFPIRETVKEVIQ